MADHTYAFDVARKHYERSRYRLNDSFVCMEIGPGDSLFSSLSMTAFGASELFLVDMDDFAVKDVTIYHDMDQFISSVSEYSMPEDLDIDVTQSLDEILNKVNAHYLTDGLRSINAIADNSVDFIWSQAVLEHIRYSEFDEYFQELYRVLRVGGVSSHRVDLKDHLSGGLKNLFFSDKVWESEFMSASGFYTNRIRHKDMISRISRAGFCVEVVNIDMWDVLPDNRELMTKRFSELPDDDLLISGFDMVLTKDR